MYVQIKAVTDLEDGMLLIKLTHTMSCYSTLVHIVRTLTLKLDKDRLYTVECWLTLAMLNQILGNFTRFLIFRTLRIATCIGAKCITAD